MKITNKHKFKDLLKYQAVINASEIDLLSEIAKNAVPLVIDGIKVKNGYDVSFEDITLYWDAKTEEDIVKQTAKCYLGIEDEKKIANLPLIDFVRLIIHAKDIVQECSDRLKAIKHEPDADELEAGFDLMKGTEFKLIRNYMKITPLKFTNYDDAFSTPWSIIVSELEHDYETSKYERELSEIKLKKQKIR